MKRKLLTAIIALYGAQNSFAENATRLEEVVVTANRIEQSKDTALADITVISREDIARAGQSTLTDLLRMQPGVEVETNGGPGQLANIHLRGTSSQSVIVLVDGMRVGSATTGTTNIAQIQPQIIDHIEIVRGPVSGLYGSDGIGGVIQIFTKKSLKNPGFGASATLGVGSFDTQQAAASLYGSNGQTQASLQINNLKTAGISALRTHQGIDADRDGYRNLSVTGSLSHQLAEGHIVGLQAFTTQGRSEFDGNFKAFQDLKQESYAATSDNQLTSFWNSHLRLGQARDVVDSIGSFGHSYLATAKRQFSWQNDFSLPIGQLILAYDRLEDRVSANTGLSKDRRINNGYLASYLLQAESHTFKLGARRDYNSQFGSYDTGNIAYGYKFNPQWKASASYGTAFRAPTFNDLYWPFADYSYTDSSGFHPYTYQGNPNLKPETSRNYEAALTYDQGHHVISLTAFHNEIRNLLVCCNGTSNDRPENIGNAKIDGLTVSYEGWIDQSHLRANAQFQDPRDDETGKTLARRAKSYGSVWLGQTIGAWELGTEFYISGKRYNDAENQIKLGGYSLLNATAQYRFNSEWSLQARANNILNRRYALATTATTSNLDGANYNTPGSNVFISVTYTPTK